MSELIQIGNNVKIPKKYHDFLISQSFTGEIRVDDKEFTLYGIRELIKQIQIDNEKYCIAKQLKGYSKALKDFLGDNTYDQYDNEFSLTRLENSFTIGFENTNILFIDSQNQNRLYTFYPDGGDVEKLDSKLSDIL